MVCRAGRSGVRGRVEVDGVAERGVVLLEMRGVLFGGRAARGHVAHEVVLLGVEHCSVLPFRPVGGPRWEAHDAASRSDDQTIGSRFSLLPYLSYALGTPE